MKKIIGIFGMHCDHCRSSVEAALNSIPGVEAKVNLKKAQAVVEFSGDIPDQTFRNALEELEFKMVSITDKKGIFG